MIFIILTIKLLTLVIYLSPDQKHQTFHKNFD